MPKKFLFLCLLLFFGLSALHARWLQPAAADQRLSATLDVRVSPADDPDPRDETSIAVSPLNPQIMVGASKVILGGGNGVSGNTRVSVYHSTDGGRTWATALLPLDTPQKVWGRASDPSVAVDLNGTFYLGALLLDNTNFDSSIYVFTSSDGGRTFGNPLPVTFDIGSGSNPKQADKCYITVDTSPTSPFKNSLYAVWTLTDRDDFGMNRATIKLAYKRPNDAAFSAVKTISHEGDMRGPSITTGPNGEVYSAWEGIGNPKVILFNASTDGGTTFFPAEVAPSIDFNVHNFTGSLSAPSPAIFINGMSRMNSFPVIDCDRSNGANRGTIYIAWAESTNRIDADIFVKKLSPPNGARPTISEPVRVNNDGAGFDQFFPWLRVDQSNGQVEVAFYDRRDDGQLLLNMYIARSLDGGTTFPENIRVSGAGSNPRLQAAVAGTNGNPIGLGDYVGLVAANGKAHLLWADTRDQKQNIYYGLVEYASAGGGDGGGVANDSCQTPKAISALPFDDSLDTRSATSAADDPVTCSGSADTHTVWYGLTPTVNATIGIDTISSDYDNVLSVYTGSCGALTRLACSGNFGGASSENNRSVVTFAATAGVKYLIGVSGKGQGGNLKLRVGYPTVTFADYFTADDGTEYIRVRGAGFVGSNAAMVIRKDDGDTSLTSVMFIGARQGDGSFTELWGTKKKLRKLVKPGRSARIFVESPIGSGRLSVPFFFVRN
ncbi:MAG: exo-alpha-sialidase [Acidobacteria bacterium]|nr:exo-alpha-sialidase [Acidobacteriota bacterium]